MIKIFKKIIKNKNENGKFPNGIHILVTTINRPIFQEQVNNFDNLWENIFFITNSDFLFL